MAKTTDYPATRNLVWLDGAKPDSNMHNDWMNDRYGPEWGENPFNIDVAASDPDIVYAVALGRTMRYADNRRQGLTGVGALTSLTGPVFWHCMEDLRDASC